MTLLHVFPIKTNRIIFNAYSGRQYACNPKYISEYIQENYPERYELIWAIKHAKRYSHLKAKGIKVVEYRSLKRLFYEATAKVSINNIGSFSWMPNNKHQLRINTWHGGGCYKKTGLSDNNDTILKKTIQMTAKNTSYMIASSKYSSDVIYPQDFGYSGRILRTGFPRNDIFIIGNKVEIRNKVCEILDVPYENKFLLFAPTWRYETKSEIVLPDFEQIKQACCERFGGNWIILFRAHDLMSIQMKESNYIDVSKYPDMQELLVTADVLISDYSSCIWDYSLQLTKPCFLFTPDLEKYSVERGFNVDIHEWGFPVCITNDELVQVIKNVNIDEFENAMRKHQRDLGSYDMGHACEKVCKVIDEFCFQ